LELCDIDVIDPSNFPLIQRVRDAQGPQVPDSWECQRPASIGKNYYQTYGRHQLSCINV
jgi:hypothetical protein